MSPRWRQIAVLCVAISVFTGCNVARPRLFQPGTQEQQRFNATIHDPYPDQDAGPEIVGGRPREFSSPRSEPARSSAVYDMIFGRR